MTWWHGTSIYQIYPRSFQDTDADGIGDLPGIIERLDYVAELGVDTVWVSPFFSSPQEDFGYDITDYRDVAEEYGTLADADRLIEEAHKRGLKVMFDLVLNHTSDQHPWFLRSRGSRQNPKADWYIWRDGRGKDGRTPPNNWRSANEITSAWNWCPERQQFYLTTFLPFQPDLNWRNAQVQEEMLATVRFWLDRGVDGFRLDIFGMLMKDPGFRDNPIDVGVHNGFPRVVSHRHTENLPETMEMARRIRAICDEYPGDRILLGEVFGSPEVLQGYLGEQDDGLNLVFLFDFLTYRYDADWFAGIIRRFEGAFPAPRQPTYVLENHDRSRTIDRVGGDAEKARVLALLLLTLRGVPTIYMGQELGMSNTRLPHRDALDPIARGVLRRVPQVVLNRLPERINRDEMRTPMQWDGTANAGFSPAGVRPWLPVNANYHWRNAELEAGDSESMLNLYRRLLRLRRTHEALRTGPLQLMEGLPAGMVGYWRDDLAVLANMSEQWRTVPVTGAILVQAGEAHFVDGGLRLGRDSAVVLQA